METENDRIETVLLSPPYDFPPRPSLALSIFKTCLTRAGIPSRTLYPMFRMSELMGLEEIMAINKMPPKTMFAEYIFSHLSGLKQADDTEEYFSFVCSLRQDAEYSSVKKTVLKGMEVAEQITEETSREIVALAPKVLAVSSVFYQLNSALAIIRRVKELDPRIITLIGGPNCMGEAGATILEYFPAVDAVFFGDGDEVFAETIKALEDGGELPYGCLRREDIAKVGKTADKLPYRLTKDMDLVPIPDFSEFMPYLKNVPEELKPLFHLGIYGPNLELTILTEGSRGCWWGQKNPCTFCSLNGIKNVYRKRSAERIFKELKVQTERYHTPLFEFTDNVIPSQETWELIRLMKEARLKCILFAEVKPIFTEQEVFRLREGGFINLQAGLETLNDHLLKLLNKGGSIANNIRFLKCLRRAGIYAYWNILFRIPGEQKEDYEEMLDLFPLLFHLPPPTGYSEIVYERRSAYVSDPGRFGMRVVPMSGYRFLYGDHEEAIEGLALHYDDEGEEEERMKRETFRYYDSLINLSKEWSNVYWRNEGCHLLMEDHGDFLTMTDTRPCRQMTLCFLKGTARRISLLCDVPKSFEEIKKETKNDPEGIPDDELKECLDFLIRNRYMIFISGKYLTLAIRK